MASPFFSIVIPTYNRARLVVAAVRSALWQTDGDFECIVVDDGSTDDTQRNLEAFRDPRLRCFFNKKNQGQHVCRNQAIRNARGEWIAFLDNDDLYLPRRLECLRAAIRQRPETGFWFTNAYVYRYGRIIGTLFDPGRRLPEGRVPGYYAVGSEYLPYVTTVVALRRESFLKTGYFREDLRMLEDTELYARMLRGGLEVGVLREPLAVRFLHEGNFTRAHGIGYVESLEALKAAEPPPEIAARIKEQRAWEAAAYLWKSPDPQGARQFLLKELGRPARFSCLYWKTFIPADWLILGKELRKRYLLARYSPHWAPKEVKEVYNLINPIIDK